MNKWQFYSLAFLLFLEILIGSGMLFDLYGQRQKLRADIDNTVPSVILLSELEAKEEGLSVGERENIVKEEAVEPPAPIKIGNIELTPQGQLANPPEIIKAVYLTSWSGGSATRINYVINLARDTDINAVVIDIKDFSGQLAYDTAIPEVEQYNGENIKIWNMSSTVRRLHEEGIYVIARVTVFQDPILAAARPDLAVQSSSTQSAWKDYKGLSWIDPAAQESWNYTVAIARDAASHGFDEINFDYVRFPSDGDLQDITFPFSDGKKLRQEILGEFFAYLKANLADVKISADLFGLTTSSRDDLGIGQVIEVAYEHFDYVYPMVYPSHYANGYNGYANPAEYPYEVVKSSMEIALERLKVLEQANPEKQFAKLRPWLQDFDLGADYDALMVQAQIQATKDGLGEDYAGYLLWAPTNWYTAGALQPFVFNQAAYNTKPRGL
jgi:hypothetical protein